MRTTRDEEFRRYVETGRPKLLRTATLLTAGDRHLAEDLVQSTLTRLYVAWPAFQRAGNQGGYVRRALVNALMDEHRRPWRRREVSLAELPDAAGPEHEAGARVDALNHAMRALPPRMRAAVVFRYFHNLSVAETADVLGCAPGTVKSQTARALDQLRDALSTAGTALPDSGSNTIPRPAFVPAPTTMRSI